MRQGVIDADGLKVRQSDNFGPNLQFLIMILTSFFKQQLSNWKETKSDHKRSRKRLDLGL